MTYHPPITVAGVVHDLAHLHPFALRVDSTKAGRVLAVHVRFSDHCFTAAAPGGGRVFSPERYTLSHRLPALIRALEDPRASVWQTAERRNWLHAPAGDFAGQDYNIFFELRRARGSAPPRDLDMVIESAYPTARAAEHAGPHGFRVALRQGSPARAGGDPAMTQ